MRGYWRFVAFFVALAAVAFWLIDLKHAIIVLASGAAYGIIAAFALRKLRRANRETRARDRRLKH